MKLFSFQSKDNIRGNLKKSFNNLTSFLNWIIYCLLYYKYKFNYIHIINYLIYFIRFLTVGMIDHKYLRLFPSPHFRLFLYLLDRFIGIDYITMYFLDIFVFLLNSFHLNLIHFLYLTLTCKNPFKSLI